MHDEPSLAVKARLLLVEAPLLHSFDPGRLELLLERHGPFLRARGIGRASELALKAAQAVRDFGRLLRPGRGGLVAYAVTILAAGSFPLADVRWLWDPAGFACGVGVGVGR